MSDQKRLQKELKGPDAFQVKVAEIIDLMAKNKKAVAVVIGLAALVAVIGFGQQLFMQHRQNVRREAFAAIEAVYNEEMEKASKERETISKTMEDLKSKKGASTVSANKDPKAKNDKKPPVDEKSLADDPEIKALQEKMDKIEPDHSKSAAEFQTYFEKNSSYPEGWVAGMRYTAWLIRNHKQADAKVILEKILKASDYEKYAFYQIQGGFILVSVLEDLGDFDGALKELEKLEKKAPNALKPRVLLARGEAQILKKDNDNARSTLDALIKDHSETAEADRARSLKLLIR